MTVLRKVYGKLSNCALALTSNHAKVYKKFLRNSKIYKELIIRTWNFRNKNKLVHWLSALTGILFHIIKAWRPSIHVHSKLLTIFLRLQSLNSTLEYSQCVFKYFSEHRSIHLLSSNFKATFSFVGSNWKFDLLQWQILIWIETIRM